MTRCQWSIRQKLWTNWSRQISFLGALDNFESQVSAEKRGANLGHPANEDPKRWVEEYKKCSGSDPWPFTKKIVTIAWLLRQIKTWLPLASGVCFLIALLVV
jgi:hypothetical protein